MPVRLQQIRIAAVENIVTVAGQIVAMTGTFTVDADPRQQILRITMSGFFEPAQIAELRDGVVTALAQLRCPPGRHLTLVDIRQMDIQSQEAVAHFEQLLSTPQVRSRKIGFVVARSLARLQIKRAASQRDAEYFENVADAEAWLTCQTEADAFRAAAAF
jgi:hypothetical protein